MTGIEGEEKRGVELPGKVGGKILLCNVGPLGNPKGLTEKALFKSKRKRKQWSGRKGVPSAKNKASESLPYLWWENRGNANVKSKALG